MAGKTIAQMMEEEETYTQVFHYPNCTVRVVRPVLTPEEYEKRLEKFKQATADFMMAVYEERSRREKAAVQAGDISVHE